MSMQIQPSTARSLDADDTNSVAATLWRRLIPPLDCGRLVIETPAGEQVVMAGPQPGPQAWLTIYSMRCLWRLVTGGDMGFAESYVAGEWSSPHIGAVLDLGLRNSAAEARVRRLRTPDLLRRARHALNRNTRWGSRRNIAAHYDLGNAFYAHWLDAGMSYSSALFSEQDQTLEAAQEAKLDRVCELLALSGGENVLEIGCGWGSLAERIVFRHGCEFTGITLSQRQLEFARRRLDRCEMGRHADLRLQDYRDVQGSYDRIVSIEMLEAVGEAYWPTYFGKLFANLRPGGSAVLQAITIDEAAFTQYRRRPDFIQKYIFPGGMLPTRQIIERETAAAGLKLMASEFFGRSYARTLAEWQHRFQIAWPAIAALGFDARFKRIWEYYLAYCQAGFEAGMIDVGLYKLERPAGGG